MKICSTSYDLSRTNNKRTVQQMLNKLFKANRMITNHILVSSDFKLKRKVFQLQKHLFIFLMRIELRAIE